MKFRPKKKDAGILLISILFALLFSNNIWHLQALLSESLLVITITLLTLILAFLTIQAGLLVVKSLLLFGGEISLILFLAQSYCAPEVTRSVQSDNAVNSLLILGLSYVSYLFLRKVYKKLKEQSKKFKEVDGRWSKEAVTMAILLVLFVGLFLYNLYLIVGPIISGLCIYR